VSTTKVPVPLTPTERHKFVALRVKAGKSNRAIAKELSVDEGTVRRDRKFLATPENERPIRVARPKKPKEPKKEKPVRELTLEERRQQDWQLMLTVVQLWITQEGLIPPDLEEHEDTIIERIEDAASRTPFVIVDLEGTASKIVVYAVSQADLVIIPTQGSQLDANEASRAIRVVMQSQKVTKSETPYAVLLTRTSSSIRTRTQAHIQNGLIASGIPVFNTELNERDAFRAVFSFQQTLDGLNPADVANLDKAKVNVWEFVEEVVERLKLGQGGDREEDGKSSGVAGAVRHEWTRRSLCNAQRTHGLRDQTEAGETRRRSGH
jgi:chromosome partitioning protein